METIIIVIIVAGVAFYFWARTSDNPLAEAVRAKVPFLFAKAATLIDSVETRTTAALLAQRGIVKKGRIGLYDIQILLEEIDVDLDEAAQEIEDDKAALALAHKAGDKETFDSLVIELNKDVAFQNELVEDRESVMNDLNALEVAVDEARDKEKLVESAGRRKVSKARRNTILAEINEARAGLTDDGSVDRHMEEADKLLKKTTARANASQTAVEGLTPGERTERKMQAYLKQAKQGTATDVNADDLWAQMSEPTKS